MSCTHSPDPGGIGAKRGQDYEKHRAPARVPRAGVYGGSAPDGLRVIQRGVRAACAPAR